MEEERIKRKKEADILKMEKLEMDLISKLQSSQLRQKNAYEELESALTLPAKEFEQKYLAGESSEPMNGMQKELSGERRDSQEELDSQTSSQNKLEQMLENGTLQNDLENERNSHKKNVLVEKLSKDDHSYSDAVQYQSTLTDSQKNKLEENPSKEEEKMEETRLVEKDYQQSPLINKKSSLNEEKNSATNDLQKLSSKNSLTDNKAD